jgi:hypothetical protein
VPEKTRSEPVKDKEKHFLKIFCAEFRSVPNLGMCYSETDGIQRKEHFFSGIMKTVLSPLHGIFLEHNFDFSPRIINMRIFCVFLLLRCNYWMSERHREIIQIEENSESPVSGYKSKEAEVYE